MQVNHEVCETHRARALVKVSGMTLRHIAARMERLRCEAPARHVSGRLGICCWRAPNAAIRGVHSLYTSAHLDQTFARSHNLIWHLLRWHKNPETPRMEPRRLQQQHLPPKILALFGVNEGQVPSFHHILCASQSQMASPEHIQHHVTPLKVSSNKGLHRRTSHEGA